MNNFDYVIGKSSGKRRDKAERYTRQNVFLIEYSTKKSQGTENAHASYPTDEPMQAQRFANDSVKVRQAHQRVVVPRRLVIIVVSRPRVLS